MHTFPIQHRYALDLGEMKCPQCQFENKDVAKFCKKCGTKLELACPSFGHPYELSIDKEFTGDHKCLLYSRPEKSAKWNYNRFVHSATYECMASDNGEVTNKLIKRYTQIAKGGAGLIIPGYLYVSPNGQCTKYQTGIHNDDMIKGIKDLVDVVHDQGSKIAFQLVHAGRQTTKDIIGQTPLGPSEGREIKFIW